MKRQLILAAAVGAVGLMAGMAQAALPANYTLTFSDLPHSGLDENNNPIDLNYQVISSSYAPSELAGTGITATWDNVALFYGSTWANNSPGAWANNDHTADTADGNNVFNTIPFSITFSQPVYVWSVWVVPYASIEGGIGPQHVTVSGYTNPSDSTPAVVVDSPDSPAHNFGVYGGPNWGDPTEYSIWEKVSLGWTPVTKITFESGYYPQMDDLRISLFAPPVLGDTNGDYIVDITDYNNVINNFGGTGLGDTNEDGMVDISDYNNVINNFGADPLNGGTGVVAVPEPASLGLLAIGALGMLRRRR